MKSAKAQREETFIDEIVQILKSVPKTRLRIVRDVVGALAETDVPENDAVKSKRARRKSLLKTPSAECGRAGRTSAMGGPMRGR